MAYSSTIKASHCPNEKSDRDGIYFLMRPESSNQYFSRPSLLHLTRIPHSPFSKSFSRIQSYIPIFAFYFHSTYCHHCYPGGCYCFSGFTRMQDESYNSDLLFNIKVSSTLDHLLSQPAHIKIQNPARKRYQTLQTLLYYENRLPCSIHPPKLAA